MARKFTKTSTTVDLERLSSKHTPEILEYLKCQTFNCGFADDFWTEEEINDWFSNLDDYCIGAFIDRKLIGFCITHHHKESNKVHLENIYVVEDHRKKDVATKMLDAIESYYRKHNKKIRYVGLVNSDNCSAVNLLIKNGFLVGKNMLWIQKTSEKSEGEG